MFDELLNRHRRFRDMTPENTDVDILGATEAIVEAVSAVQPLGPDDIGTALGVRQCQQSKQTPA